MSGLPPSLPGAVESLGLGDAIDTTSLGGGAWRIELHGGVTLFAKTGRDIPADLYATEERGLLAIAATETIATPRVLVCSSDYLILEWLGGERSQAYWHILGEQLAALHGCQADTFGFTEDNYCGMTRQPNPRMRDGYAFFADARLRHQTRLALDAGYLDTGDNERLETIIRRLPEWIPAQPPALIHGDLWAGNVACTGSGGPALIDPAAHYGWHEAELAMTTLFGGFAPAFYDAYLESSGANRDWRERASLYNLYHLLNHLNLFGTGYLADVRDVLKRFGGGR